MTSNEKFHKDLNDGQKGERVIAEYICDKRGYNVVEYGNDSRYDFKLDDVLGERYITFEVKTDRYEYFKGYNTYNMFIEQSCSGKPSGVDVTQADYFVYYYPDWEEAYMIKVDDLRELIIKEGFKETSQAGDGGRVTGVLIHRNLYKNHFNVIKIKKDINIFPNK